MKALLHHNRPRTVLIAASLGITPGLVPVIILAAVVAAVLSASLLSAQERSGIAALGPAVGHSRQESNEVDTPGNIRSTCTRSRISPRVEISVPPAPWGTEGLSFPLTMPVESRKRTLLVELAEYEFGGGQLRGRDSSSIAIAGLVNGDTSHRRLRLAER